MTTQGTMEALESILESEDLHLTPEQRNALLAKYKEKKNATELQEKWDNQAKNEGKSAEYYLTLYGTKIRALENTNFYLYLRHEDPHGDNDHDGKKWFLGVVTEEQLSPHLKSIPNWREAFMLYEHFANPFKNVWIAKPRFDNLIMAEQRNVELKNELMNSQKRA